MAAKHKPLPARHETFCQHVAEGCSPADAARRVGFPPAAAAGRGAELCARTEIQDRICELEDERAAEMKALRTRTLTRLDTIYEKAMETDRISLAFRAVMALTRIGGLHDGTRSRAKSRSESALSHDDTVPEEALPIPPQLQSALDMLLDTPSPQPGPFAPEAFASGGMTALPVSALGPVRRPAAAAQRP